MRRQVRFARIAGVLKEWETAMVAADLLIERSGMQTSLPRENIPSSSLIQVFRDNLEMTYLIRLFAEFEVGLREAWARAFNRTTEPRVRDLIDAIAALRGIPDLEINGVHLTRLYRNAIVHEGDEAAIPVPLPTAKHHLCRFFSRLPLDW